MKKLIVISDQIKDIHTNYNATIVWFVDYKTHDLLFFWRHVNCWNSNLVKDFEKLGFKIIDLDVRSLLPDLIVSSRINKKYETVPYTKIYEHFIKPNLQPKKSAVDLKKFSTKQYNKFSIFIKESETNIDR